MKKHDEKSILAKARELWPANDLRDFKIKVEIGSDRVAITLSQMYEAPGLSFTQLNSLAEFFDTLNVETESEFHHGGCETCDYGSEYGFTLWIREGDPFNSVKP